MIQYPFVNLYVFMQIKNGHYPSPSMDNVRLLNSFTFLWYDMPCQVLPNIKKATHKRRQSSRFFTSYHHLRSGVPQTKEKFPHKQYPARGGYRQVFRLIARQNGSHTPSRRNSPVTDSRHVCVKTNTATALLRIRTWFLVRLGSFWLKALLLHLYPDSYSFFIILPSYYSVVNRDLMNFKCLCYFIFQINASFLNI